MSPKDYYYQHFRNDFEKFWKLVPSRPNYVTREPLFKFAGLVKKDDFDTLKGIERENLVYFLSALGCTILIDQVMYTHFKDYYHAFQKMTLYPKMWIGWINANPWMVFHPNVRLPRGLHKKQVLEKFSTFCEFFVSDLKEFFKKHEFENATWKAVRTAMLKDPDVSRGVYGKLFIEHLKALNSSNPDLV